MDLPTTPDEVLAQPTRARIFALLTESSSPAASGEIAAALGLHVNGVRRHLERLVEANLVERRREQGGRGRPGDRWVVAPEARPGGQAPTAYQEIAVGLARAFPTGPGPMKEIGRVGREIGRNLAEAGEGATGQELVDVLARLGFEPRLEPEEDGGFSCHLGNCPYRESALANPDVVCELHRSMTVGLLERLDPDASLTGFEVRDPREAGCVVSVG